MDVTTFHRASDQLRTLPQFAEFSSEILQKLGDRVHVLTVPSGHTIYSPTQPADTLYILAQGAVKLYRLSPEGRIVITGMINPGEIFGEMALVGAAIYGNYAEASINSEIYAINAEHMRNLLYDIDVAQQFAQMLGNRISELEYQLSVVALKPVSERVIAILSYLNRQTKDFAKDAPEIHITHEELAHMVGANRESVTKVLNEFQLQGVVALRRGSITLLQPDLIQNSCQGNVI